MPDQNTTTGFANINGAQQVVMSGTAHLPNMERRAQFNRHVLDFLEQIKT